MTRSRPCGLPRCQRMGARLVNWRVHARRRRGVDADHAVNDAGEEIAQDSTSSHVTSRTCTRRSVGSRQAGFGDCNRSWCQKAACWRKRFLELGLTGTEKAVTLLGGRVKRFV